MCLIPSVFQILLSWEPKLTASSSEVLTLQGYRPSEASRGRGQGCGSGGLDFGE